VGTHLWYVLDQRDHQLADAESQQQGHPIQERGPLCCCATYLQTSHDPDREHTSATQRHRGPAEGCEEGLLAAIVHEALRHREARGQEGVHCEEDILEADGDLAREGGTVLCAHCRHVRKGDVVCCVAREAEEVEHLEVEGQAPHGPTRVH
jgi:hypothetical protein